MQTQTVEHYIGSNEITYVLKQYWNFFSPNNLKSLLSALLNDSSTSVTTQTDLDNSFDLKLNQIKYPSLKLSTA